jgi:hypothetical protein|tara:strand:- start:3204 stop:3533 length:330 start_codon:yes stop_codon:yes gene_type:complete
MISKPAYYSILTAKVRYDNDISMGAKILFSEITALSNKKGYCFATNGYFAKLYDVTETTVSLWVKALIERKHIKAKYQGGVRMLYVPQQTVRKQSKTDIRKLIDEVLND